MRDMSDDVIDINYGLVSDKAIFFKHVAKEAFEDNS